MRYSPYKAKPDRFNPEFIGIADTYNQQKHSRQLSESERKTYHSSCQYENNLNQQLIKTIEHKSKELKVLKAAKARHEKELRDKEQYQQKCAEELERLRQHNLKSREKSKHKRQAARNALFKRNHSQKLELDDEMNMIRSYHETVQAMTSDHKEELYNLGREQHLITHMHVDSFHRSKNKQSLQQYKQKINEEMRLAQSNKEESDRYKQRLSKLDRYVSAKKDLLKSIDRQIDNYRTNYRSIPTKSMKNALLSAISCDSKLFASEMQATQ